MRLAVFLGLASALVTGLVITTHGQGAATDPSAVLASARSALGGDEKLGGVKTFVATGRVRQIRGNNLVPIEFEIVCELPDKYVRRDEVPAQETGITASGFNGDALIQVPPPPEPPPQMKSAPTAAPAGGPLPTPPDPRKARVTSLKQDFVRLTLGMFASSFNAYPLTFTLVGRAEAPQGTADIVDVKGPGNFTVKLFISSETHLPIMISWTTPATNVVFSVPGQAAPENPPPGSVVVPAPPPPGATATKEEQQQYGKDIQDLRKKTLASARPVEYRIYYADYRDVGGGVRFPFRLRKAIAGETVEEMNFDTFKLNARIDARRFTAIR